MGGKKTNGRKRQLLVDTRGNILALIVHAADVQDRDALVLLLDEFRDMFPRLIVILADEGYRAEWLDDLSQEYGITIQIVTKPADQVGFVVQKLRWIAERTIAWVNRSRRLSKDYECLAQYSESMIYLASIRTTLKRLFPRRPGDIPYRNKQRTPSTGAILSQVGSVAR
jgi:putative transposase